MQRRSWVGRVRLGVLVLVFTAWGGWAAAQNPRLLRYGFQAGKQYAYDVKIHADTEDTEETREGVLTYTVLSATDEQVVLRQSGGLAERVKPKPGKMVIPMGPPMFMGPPAGMFGGPEGITINRQGRVLVSGDLTSLPYLLGDRELLLIEELPAEPKNTWVKQTDVVIRQRSGGGPFGRMRFGGPFADSTTDRTAKERIDFTVAGTQPDGVRITKRYSLQTEQQGGEGPRFQMTGSGEFLFDPTEGVIKLLTMKYEVRVHEKNTTVQIPITVTCRLLTPAELAEHQKRAEEARAAAEEAAKPKALAAGDRAELLRDLRSGDENRMKSAADRLAKATVDGNPAEVAKALAPLLSHANSWVQGAAAKALEVWVVPEVEADLIKATTSGNLWVRASAIRALGKIKTPQAAEAVAAQMYRHRGEAGEALRAIGPMAEQAAIGCLRDRDFWVRVEACKVLEHIGGQAALEALRRHAAQAEPLETMHLQRAITAIEQRLANAPATPEPAAPASTAPPPTETAVAPAAAASQGGFRTWRDSSGVYQIEAVLVEYKDQKVTLKKKDGSTIQIPLEKLSTADQQFVVGQSPFE